MTNFSKLKDFNIILLVILSSITIFIYFPLFQESVYFKQLDFQWSPSKLVSQGINHYDYMLNGNREGIIGSQYGEYLHGLYVLFYPFTILSWENAKIIWFIFNFFIAIIIPLLICKKFEIKDEETILIVFFFLCSNVTKAHMVIGQQSLLILFFFCLPFIRKSKINVILSGISYLKYSIGYVLFLNFAINKKINLLLLSFIIPVTGWLFYCLITDSNFLHSAFQPFELAIQNHLINIDGIEIMPKNIFLFSFFEFFQLEHKSIVALLISLSVNTYFIFQIKNLDDELKKLSCLLISTLIFFPHYPHNFVLVLPLLIYSVKNFNKFSSKISFFASIYFLSFFRAIEIYVPSYLNNIIPNPEFFIKYLNIIFLFLILLINVFENKIFLKKIKLKQ